MRVVNFAPLCSLFVFHVTTLLPLRRGEPKTNATAYLNQSGKRISKKGNVEMVLVRAGEFTMGGAGLFEQPQHQVNVGAYLIGLTDVTVGQYRVYCADQGIDFSKFPKPRWGWIDDHPMVNVNWQQARDFCEWAGGDLPTEAQWEKAARGKNGNLYPWGDKFDPTCLWCSKKVQGDVERTAPVGSYRSGASHYGCLDMEGNVAQWCLDKFMPVPKNIDAEREGDPNKWRMIKGDSWFPLPDPYTFLSATRWGRIPTAANPMLGFRLACAP